MPHPHLSDALPHASERNFHLDSGRAYRPDIDGLRAIAILSVVAFHAGIPGVTGGFVGVDVFFVISGYLITALLVLEMHHTGTLDLKAFYARRIRRLLPALLVVVAVTLLIGVLVMFPLDLRRLARSATAVVFVVSNLHFLNYSGGYFDPSTDLMPLLHTWSLSIEEQYYLSWPLILLALGWGARRFKGARLDTLVLFTLLAILLASFAASLWYLRASQPAAFYLMPARAWELALGGFVWLAQSRVKLAPRAGGLLALLGLAAIAATVFLLDDSMRFPGTAALPPTLGAAAVLFGLRYAGEGALAGRLLAARPMVNIGLLSYSWYLWHWPLLSLERNYFLGARDPLRDGGFVLLALLCAAASYRWIEYPIRYRKPWWFASIPSTLKAGALLSLLALALASAVSQWGKIVDSRMDAGSKALRPAAEQPFGSGKCQEPSDGRHLAPQAECVLGSAPGGIALAAWGDSHAGHLAGLLSANSDASGHNALVRSSKYCPPLVGVLPYKRGEGLFPCGYFNGAVLDEFADLSKKGLRGIVLAARWNVYLDLLPTDPGRTASIALVPDLHHYDGTGDQSAALSTTSLDSAGSARTMAAALKTDLEAFRKLGLRVLIIAPEPELTFNGPQCLYRKSAAECVMPRQRVDERRALAVKTLKEAAAGFDNVRLWDPIDQYCDATWCYAERDGLILYRDADHISDAMSRKLLGTAKPYLDWLAAPH
jgi:peptidoglycan/LPS O-acetylase OafA/YrhL